MIRVVLIIGVLFCLPTSVESAVVVSFPESSVIVESAPPSSVRRSDLVSDTHATVFRERSGVLTETIRPNIVPSQVTAPFLAFIGDDTRFSGAIPIGSGYTSFYVHIDSTFDDVSNPFNGTTDQPVVISGSVTFDEEILGIISISDRDSSLPDIDGLAETDSLLGAPITLYPIRTQFDHDLDFDIPAGTSVPNPTTDVLQFTNNNRTVSFSARNTDRIDAFRVIVATAIPEPSSTPILSAISLIGIATTRRSRRRTGR